jgi:hypothetical protein
LEQNRFDVGEALIIVSKGAEPGIPLMDQLMEPSANEFPDRSNEPMHQHSPAEQANGFHFHKPYTISLHCHALRVF